MKIWIYQVSQCHLCSLDVRHVAPDVVHVHLVARGDDLLLREEVRRDRGIGADQSLVELQRRLHFCTASAHRLGDELLCTCAHGVTCTCETVEWNVCIFVDMISVLLSLLYHHYFRR